MKNKTEEIASWLRNIYGSKNAVIAVSGGVDSAVALTLLTKALGADRVTPVLLPYGNQDMSDGRKIIEFNGLEGRAVEINIATMVDPFVVALSASDDRLRTGNIMARTRMICVFDIAKKVGGMVCGTENKSEHHLGYFTRFGDSASDVEPIAGLYKTEVWEMAKSLGLPENFYTKEPSAGLWEGQTDVSEMGFSYHDADMVLQGKTDGMDKQVVEKVQKMITQNKFKLEVPYVLG